MRSMHEIENLAWDELTPEEQERERRLEIAVHAARLEQMAARMIKPADLFRGVTNA